MSEEMKEEQEKMNFVTIRLSKKQVDFSRIFHNEKTDKDYVRVFAPGGGTFFYPKDSLKEYRDKPDLLYFSRPEGTEITVNYSERKENVPDNAPNKEKYHNYSKTIVIEDLKEMYAQERQRFIDEKNAVRDSFVNMTVPTEWGKKFQSKDGKELVSISVPFTEGDEKKYYSFVIPQERFRESEKKEGFSYFGFPKNKKETEEPYEVQLKRSEKQADGTYVDVKKNVSSVELCNAVNAALDKQEYLKNEEYLEINKDLTSKDVVKCFEESKERYVEQLRDQETNQEQPQQQEKKQEMHRAARRGR